MILNLELWPIAAGIKVQAKLELGEIPREGFSFCLNKKLSISGLTCQGKPVDYKTIDDAKVLYKSAKRIEITGKLPGRQLLVEYSGPVDGYHTKVSEDLLAVNYYSAWYPDEFAVAPQKTNVIIHGDYDAVLFSSYDGAQNAWHYTPLDFDCNILAMKNCKTLQGPGVTLYYYGDNDELAQGYLDAYVSAAAFNKSLYGAFGVQNTNLCILPNGRAFDGYCRKGLIVLGGFTDDLEYVRHLLAHEIAHNWCSGADIASWEDWLNETTAEWTALLLELHSNNEPYFAKRIAAAKGQADAAPPIKTADGSRPEGVHHKGVMLFYDIYANPGSTAACPASLADAVCSAAAEAMHGYKVIAALLKIYKHLEVKTTESFIAAIERNGMPDVARRIAEGIMA